METKEKIQITVSVTINAPIDTVWELWTTPEHITKWNYASDDWHTPKAVQDLKPGGHFVFRMEAKDGSFGFDFGGTYDEVKTKELIAYSIGDGRKVTITFTGNGLTTQVAQTFEAENQNPVEMQKNGWQSIMDNFKKYTESTLHV